MVFEDRTDAGRRLADALRDYADKSPVVFALPRGGVTVAAEVARALGAPLDLVIARKVGHPSNPEYAIGAVTDDGESLLNEGEVAHVEDRWLQRAIERETNEARRRRERYLGPGEPRDVAGKTAILIDDGIATGFTLRTALKSLRKRAPSRIVVAAPVAPDRTVELLQKEADDVVVLHRPELLYAIGAYYEDFSPVSDRAVEAALREFRS